MPTPTKHFDKKGFKKATSTKVWNVDVRNCVKAPELEREVYDDLPGLTKSIDQHGIIQVLWGKRDPKNPEKFIIYDGGSRIDACQPLIKAGKKITACVRVVPANMTMAEIYSLQITLNRGKRYEDFENAKVLKKLMEVYGKSLLQIQKDYNWTPQYVKSLDLFNKATGPIQQLVRKGNLSLTYLMELYAEHKDFKKVEEILNLAKVVLKKRNPHANIDEGQDASIQSPTPDDQRDTAEVAGETDEDDIDDDKEGYDVLFYDCARYCVETQNGSTSQLQRQFKIGYNRAGRIVSQLETKKVLGEFKGAKDREVLIKTIEEFELKFLPPGDRSTKQISEPPALWTPPVEPKNPQPKKPAREKSSRITSKHVDEALKKVNSFSELWKFMEENKDESMQKELTPAGLALWTFAEGLRENKFTAADFPKMFYGEKAG